MPSVIFAGSKVKTLKSTLSLNGGADVISSTVDPTAVAVDANPGSLLLNTTTGKQYRKNDSGSSTNWTEVGAGTSGINYITNPSAATNTTGWATYADAASAIPVDGTGGSPTVTWTRSTTTPLRGTADFNFTTPGGGSVQGQGVSTDLIIDLADQAKVLTVTFDYEVLSGTYASGDLTCYLIADPAGTPSVIQPAGYVVQAATVGTKMRQIATFQTNVTGQTYRLCLHVASTSTAAYVLAVDNVSVGPQVVQYGAPVTDWQSYSLTIGATTTPPTPGTVTINSAKWRRVGDSMEISYQFEQSASGTAGSGTYLFPLPLGYSVDPSKLAILNPARTVVGSAKLSFGLGSTGSTTPSGTVIIGTSNPNNFIINYPNTTIEGTNSVGSGGYGLNNANISYSLEARVPILGWSSTVVMSNDTDTRVVAAKAVSTGTQGIAGSVGTLVTLGSVSFDTHGKFSTGSNLYTVPVPGFYRVIGKVGFSVNQSSVTIVAVQVDGVTGDVLQGANQTAAGEQFRLSGSTLLQLKAGQTIGLVAFSSAATTINAIDSAYLQIELLSGPSAIAASETVAARYESTGNRTPTSSKALNYDSRVFDTHGAVTTVVGDVAGWRFTAPIAGKYSVSISNYVSSSTVGSLTLAKNGTSYAFMAQTNLTTGVIHSSALIDLNATDFIDIRSDGAPTCVNVVAKILAIQIHKVA